MMKKRWLTILALVLTAVSCCALGACSAGEQGIQGEPGKDGKSAYQIWLDLGNTGTEADFLNWLKGEKGDKGDQGTPGEKGDQGIQGETGLQGETGATGETGKSAYQIWLDNGYTGTEVDFLAWLQGETIGSNLRFQKISGKEEYCVIGLGMESDLDIVIPATYRGLPVTEIKYGAFSDTEIENVTISEGIKVIESNVFNYCGKLKSVTIPSSVTMIQSIWDNDLVAWDVYYTGDIASWIQVEKWKKFSGSNYPNLYIDGKNVDEITELTIPNTITEIKSNSFGFFSNLQSVEIPDSVTTIGSYAFYECSSLTNVVIGDSVTSIGDGVFSGCSSLTSIEIPDSVTTIGYDAFSGCSSLTSIEIPDSVTSIGDGVFSGCSSLTSIEIPDSVVQIGEYVFSDCASLQFEEYEGLKYLGNTTNPYFAVIGEIEWGSANIYTIHPDAKVIAGAAFQESVMRGLSIPDGMLCIGDNLFSNACRLNELYIPSSVKYIGARAFDSGRIKAVYYGGSETDWDEIEFFYYEGMDEISWPSDTILYFYSESEPTTEGNYWHYDENGEVAIW